MSQKSGAEGTGLRRGPRQEEAGGTRQGQSRAEAGASPEVQVQTQLGTGLSSRTPGLSPQLAAGQVKS